MRILTIGALLIIALIQIGCATDSAQGKNDELPVGCLVKPDPGPCHAAQTKFYYDYRDDRCKPFKHGGCDGRIPFQTLNECAQYCVSGG
jgi:hypothetical protein